MSLTDDAIAKIRESVRSGRFVPGGKLPPEHELAAELGVSRSPVREAVKVLAVSGVLDVRRGDGTYVTSLAPRLLLAGDALAERDAAAAQASALLHVITSERWLHRHLTNFAQTSDVWVC